eukprot:1394580-Rhodomonas_salina.1
MLSPNGRLTANAGPPGMRARRQDVASGSEECQGPEPGDILQQGLAEANGARGQRCAGSAPQDPYHLRSLHAQEQHRLHPATASCVDTVASRGAADSRGSWSWHCVAEDAVVAMATPRVAAKMRFCERVQAAGSTASVQTQSIEDSQRVRPPHGGNTALRADERSMRVLFSFMPLC